MRAFRKVLSVLFVLAVVAVPFLIFANAQALTDWWQLHNYDPSAEVASLASQDAMTPYARHVFYVNHPDLESSASQFRTDCQETEKTIILGCYHGNQRGIFVYNVKDPRLEGVEQVTAAHEMLHAAYDRLSKTDKDNVDGMLQDYFNNQLHDKRIIDDINAYKGTEPGQLVNEMHSIFGTEIASLPTGLDNYYKKYFTDRSKVTGFEKSYQSEFNRRENRMKAYAAQLAQMKVQIDSDESSLSAQLSQVNADRARLDELKASGQISQYNQSVPAFNSAINSYNVGIEALRTEIRAYNDLVQQANAVAGELETLNKAIDTRSIPQPAQ